MSKFIFSSGNDNHFLDIALSVDDAPFQEVYKAYGVLMLMEETSEAELHDLAQDLPTDTHLVTYRTSEDVTGVDAVRSHSKVDIFDAYYDNSLTVLDIKSGFGTIKPKLFQDSKKK